MDFHELEEVIEKLEGRLELRKAVLDKDPRRFKNDQVYRNISQMLYKMRTIRDAVLVVGTNSPLH